MQSGSGALGVELGSGDARVSAGGAASLAGTLTLATLDGFTRAFADALAAGDLTTLVAKVEAVGPSAYVTDLSLLENRFQFARSLRR